MAELEVKMEVGSDGVAVITISNPPVNAFAVSIIASLKEKVGQAMSRDDVKAIVLTGKHGKFSGGFDINVFQKVQQTGKLSLLPDLSIDLVINLIEDAKKPIVAAIEGLALGAGLEVAMSCHARIAAPKAQLGLPELSLGIIPGAGGTQRLPRLLGLPKAIDMMLTSKPILSEEGKKLGLIDAIVPPQELLKVSRQWALDIADKRKPWVRSLHIIDKIGSLSEAREILEVARQQAKRTAPNLPQHQACLDVIEEGIVQGGYPGVLKEGKVFNELVVSDTSKGLVHVFFAQRATSKVPNVTNIGLKPRAVKKVAVIGGGLMGSGIATALIVSNIYVVLKEVNSEYLLKGIKLIEANVRGLVARKKLAQSKADKALSMIKGVLDYSEFNDVDMVIEAVIENVQLKQKIFGEIEKACPPHCILATNTSTIDLRLVGEKLRSQDRVVGAHFFSPAHVMPLLEIVRTEKTSAQVILDLMTVGKIIKKVPVVVGNCTGFAVNRAFFPYKQSAHILLLLGVDLFRIDRLISSFGLPMGPFQLEDLTGYGVAVAVGKEFATAFPDRSFTSPVVDLLIRNGRNGKNNGKGYYLYEKGSKPKPDPMVLPIIEESPASSFETSLTLKPRNSFRDVSFSSYLNSAEENMIQKLTNQASDIPNDHHYPHRKKSEEDEEIGVFGAEKYFKGEIEDGNSKNDRRFLDATNSTSKMHQQDERVEEFDHGFPGKERTDQTNMHTPSVRSNASTNSRSGLLPRTKQTPGNIEKGSKTRIFLASFGCNCIDKKSTQISEKKFIQTKEISKPQTKMFDFYQRTDPLSSKFAEKNARNDYFTFPVLNSNDSNSNSNSISSLNSRSGNLAGKIHGENNGRRLSLGRKLRMLNDWDMDIPTEDEMYIPSSGMYNNDIDSDSSSDLFEIESFSTAGNSSFLAHRTSESNCYAPSEVSIDWSVVTASAADFSVASDYEEVRTGGGGWKNTGRKAQVTDQKDEQKKRPGILSGCTSHKAVRVSGDEYKVSGGGPGRRQRWLSESMAVGSMFRGVNNVTRFDPTRGNHGSDVYPMSESKGRHASQLLYIQQ